MVDATAVVAAAAAEVAAAVDTVDADVFVLIYSAAAAAAFEYLRSFTTLHWQHLFFSEFFLRPD